ncbi:MAG TPA: phenylalanine--tRNA ligase subunit beta [Thermoanaerobaculia bacterium]|nr:phenylalanine--tRNA ligase subunit beta [Thermoanaerobaculia bacterium]
MKLSRDWISDYVDLSDISDADLERRFTEIGHAIEAVEKHGDDTVFDLEITTNRVDAMSHLGMARELAAALGRELRGTPRFEGETTTEGSVKVRIEAPEMCARFSGFVIRGVSIKPSPERIQRRLEAVGLRPINNVVDATNYVMMALGHPLHAYDLAKVGGETIIVRAGRDGESMRSLDSENRKLDRETCVIADSNKAIGLGGVIGGENSEISNSTKDILLECAWFEPTTIRRTARRLGVKTDASYRFERRVDPNDTLIAVTLAGDLVAGLAGGTPEIPLIDVVARTIEPKTLTLRTAKLHEQSGGAVGAGYALDLFRRLGFAAQTVHDGIRVTVPTYRGDIHEEMDLVEEVLRFFGLNNVPAALPRVTTGDIRVNAAKEAEDDIRRILVGCGMSESINYSFFAADFNGLFTPEAQIAITNALSENIAAMRLTMMPGLLESVAFNRSYGTRDGALFEVGRTYHRDGEAVREGHRAAAVLYGDYDFFDIKGVVDQIAIKFHVPLEYSAGDDEWLQKGKRAVARYGDRHVATLGFIAQPVLQRFGVKGDVLAAELDIEAVLASTGEWKMAPVARFPGVPMILALTQGRDLEYQRIIETIRSLDVPFLHEVGLRDRFTPDPDTIKTTLGMWYQAFDRSLTQDEVAEIHQNVASRVADLLPVKVL